MFLPLSFSGGHLYPQISGATNVSLYSPGTSFDKRPNLAEAVSFHQEPAMRQSIRFVAPITLLVVASTVLAASLAAQVPQQLQPPANTLMLLKVHAKGDQVYTCKADAAQFTWTLKAPDAQLFDENGKPFGKHFAGPSWEANDGSRVTGKAVANAPSPEADSIPWLLVNVVAHEGSGVLSRATSIQRLNTKGGKAPAAGCDAAHVGQEVRASYSADYLFFAPK
jgi:hypothetical protein